MARISIIAAIGKNNELGKNNGLIWNLKGDLKFFKETTMNHKIIMGYNTFCSLPRLLPGREHIVLTHKNIKIEGAKVFNNFEDLKNYLSTLSETVYVIGGGMIYNLFVDIADELILTEIDAEFPKADVYFPKFNQEEYKAKVIAEKEENYIRYKHVKYKKKHILTYEEYCEMMDEVEKHSETWIDPALEKFSKSSKVKKLGKINDKN